MKNKNKDFKVKCKISIEIDEKNEREVVTVNGNDASICYTILRLLKVIKDRTSLPIEEIINKVDFNEWKGVENND